MEEAAATTTITTETFVKQCIFGAVIVGRAAAAGIDVYVIEQCAAIHSQHLIMFVRYGK